MSLVLSLLTSYETNKFLFKTLYRILNVNFAIYATKKPDSIVSDLFYYYGGPAGTRTPVQN